MSWKTAVHPESAVRAAWALTGLILASCTTGGSTQSGQSPLDLGLATDLAGDRGDRAAKDMLVPRADVPDLTVVAEGPVISDDLIERWLRGLMLLSYCFDYAVAEVSGDWSARFLDGAPTLLHAGLSERGMLVFGCLTTVDSCEAFDRCVGFRRAEECTGAIGSATSCANDRLQLCSFGAPLTLDVDCAALGGTCGRGGPGVDVCGLPECDSQRYGCRGGDRIWCAEEVSVVDSCWNRMGCKWAHEFVPDSHYYRRGPCIAYVTKTCTPGDTEGTAFCSGDGPPCDEETATAECDGDILRNCVGGRVSESRCGDLIEGMTCAIDPDYGATCRYPDYECDPVFTPATCAGDVLTACIFGHYRSFDCGMLPGGTCEVVDRHGGGYHYATCVNPSR